MDDPTGDEMICSTNNKPPNIWKHNISTNIVKRDLIHDSNTDCKPNLISQNQNVK